MTAKTIAEARANFEASIAYIPDRYVAGVRRADWATPAGSESAEKNYAAGVQKAISKKSRQAGVRKVPNSEWQEAAATKGGAIIGERIRGALDKWQSEFGPIYDAVVSKAATLPPRTVDWRANINSRLVPIVETWKRASGKL